MPLLEGAFMFVTRKYLENRLALQRVHWLAGLHSVSACIALLVSKQSNADELLTDLKGMIANEVGKLPADPESAQAYRDSVSIVLQAIVETAAKSKAAA